jgi:hypothetical protein
MMRARSVKAALVACSCLCVLWCAIVLFQKIFPGKQLGGASDQQVTLMQAAIQQYVIRDQSVLQGFGGLVPAGDDPKILCEINVIEAEQTGRQWRDGLVMNCGEFGVQGKTLLEGSSGYPGIAEVAELSEEGSGFSVDSLVIGPDWADSSWVDGNFSSEIASWVLSSSPPTAPDPIAEAWNVFRLRNGTTAEQE